ncbi:MAG: prepilin-type N-terminal cleavage/methylation domain-containing protein [Desulfomonilia bacterium]
MKRKQGSKELSRRENGFTLVELAVAILVFSLGILGIAKLQMMAVQGNAFSMQITEGICVAQNTIERLMDLPQTSTSLGGEADLSDGPYQHDGPTQIQRNMVFKTQWLVSQVGTTGLRQVDVQVSWEEKGTPHAITLSFIKGKQ